MAGDGAGEKPTILYVEDNWNRSYSAFHLEEGGFRCVSSGSLSESREYLKQGGFAGVFFASLRIPAEKNKPPVKDCDNGIELVRDVQEKGLPIVVLTGASGDVLDNLRVLGVEEVVEKPVNPSEYVAAAKRAFGDPSSMKR